MYRTRTRLVDRQTFNKPGGLFVLDIVNELTDEVTNYLTYFDRYAEDFSSTTDPLLYLPLSDYILDEVPDLTSEPPFDPDGELKYNTILHKKSQYYPWNGGHKGTLYGIGPLRTMYLYDPFRYFKGRYHASFEVDGYPSPFHERTFLRSYEYLLDEGQAYDHAAIDNAYLLSDVIQSIRQDGLNDQNLLGMGQTFNILSFIAELKDIRSLPKLLTKWGGGDRIISDKYLGVSFGVLPFYSDIMAVIKTLSQLGPSIDRWNDMARQWKSI